VKKIIIVILVLLFHLSAGQSRQVFAQEEQPVGPLYIVQEGDSLWDIAFRFGISLDSLANSNGITDASQLSIGDELVIPGLEGIQGYLTTDNVSYGETLRSLSRKHQIPEEMLVKLNRLTTSHELYVDRSLVILEPELNGGHLKRETINPGQSVFEKAVSHGINPWRYIIDNNLPDTSSVLPGDVLHMVSAEIDGSTNISTASSKPSAFPETIAEISIKPLPAIQGKTEVLRINSENDLEIKGSLLEQELVFFQEQAGEYIGIQGIHAMTEPGIYPLYLQFTSRGSNDNGERFSFSQPIYVKSGGYAFDPVLEVSPETIDPAITRPEDAQWAALFAPLTDEKLWDGTFESPAPPDFADCWPSLYGNRRSYNGSPYAYFHTGLDFCGGVGTQIFAPAAGQVVFAGPLTVRGNATVINHGRGIYSAYMHQSEILVNVGDIVEPGQVIGLVGGTGRVTGPHLHWEIWAGGIQVDPVDWLEQAYPELDDQPLQETS
jgi:murein DD-endopeptidase MepM/ murein hydrolase activator NlpD